MEWYIPMTIIPGIAIIITSSSNIMLELNNEISNLSEQENKNLNIISAKLTQLKKLSISIVFQYIGVLLFLFSGILKSLKSDADTMSKFLLIIGVLAVTISIIILLIYSIKAVSIRQKHLKL